VKNKLLVIVKVHTWAVLEHGWLASGAVGNGACYVNVEEVDTWFQERSAPVWSQTMHYGHPP
jgi:lipid-binding SYLF domain-containing protein